MAYDETGEMNVKTVSRRELRDQIFSSTDLLPSKQRSSIHFTPAQDVANAAIMLLSRFNVNLL